MPQNYRFTLAPYAGPKSRLTCPGCDEPRSFTPYVDTVTGEQLPAEYGRCDREINCGYELNPYTRPAGGGVSYATATERDEQHTPAPPPRPRPSPPPAAVYCIPAEVCRAAQGSYERNTLARLLQQHFGAGVAAGLLARFHVGTSAYWSGACVFWLFDELGRVRGGQIADFDETGHTVKEIGADGKLERRTGWVHIALARVYRRRGQAAPTWLTEYASHGQKSPCLFGLPQLATAPAGQPVAIVEAPKTALFATPYFPGFVWLATMALAWLTAERMEPLRGRRVVLYPDAGALDKWEAKAAELRGLGFDVEVSDMLETIATDEQRAAGIDVADVLLAEWPGYPPSWDDTEATSATEADNEAAPVAELVAA